MKVTNFALLLASASYVRAWSGGSWSNSTVEEFPCLTESKLDAQVPACAQSCQQTALAADGCDDYEDVACHCAATAAIGDILTPCLANSTCSSDDLTALQNLITPVCTYFNATANGLIAKPVCNVAAPTPSASSPPAVSPPPTVSDVGCPPAITRTQTIWVSPTPTPTPTKSVTAVSQPITTNGTYTGPIFPGGAAGGPTAETAVVVFVGFIAVWVL